MEAESLAESESEESSDLVWIGTTEATGAEAESEEKEHLILLTPIPSSFRLHFRFLFWFTLDRNAPCAPDSDSASDSIASVNQPLHGTANKVKSLKGYWVRYWSKTKVITLARDNQLNQSKLEPSDAKHVLVTTGNSDWMTRWREFYSLIREVMQNHDGNVSYYRHGSENLNIEQI